MTAGQKGVDTTHDDYNAFAPKWSRARDVIAGQDAMHRAGIRYLPKLREEEQPDYDARKARSDFFGGTWRTIDALGGMAFAKAPTCKVPDAIEPLLDDVNMAGSDLTSLASEMVEEVLSVGRVGLLVDHPPRPEGVAAITQAVAETLGLRPSIQIYTAESCINWKYARRNNAWVLVQVVLKECEAIPDGEFAETREDRYRVLDLDEAGNYRQRLFKRDKGKDEQIGDDIYPAMGGKPLSYIPFMFVGTGGKADTIDEPPLIDLIDKNVAHYQVNSDYRHGLHFTALPTLFLAGVSDEQKFYIGSTAAVVSSHPEAKGEFIEFKGQGLGGIEKALDRLERQMALLGARMIADETRQAETLGATQIKRAGENSVLAKIVQGVSKSLEWALGIFCEWAGASAEVSYEINRDFSPTGLSAQDLTALVGAVQAGQISEQEFYALLQRHDVVDPAKPFEDHQSEIDEQGPAAPMKAVAAANDPNGGMAA